jgi:hypothetical protein
MARLGAASIWRREDSVSGGRIRPSFPRRVGLTLLLLLVGLVVLLLGAPVKTAQVTLTWDRNAKTTIAGYFVRQ